MSAVGISQNSDAGATNGAHSTGLRKRIGSISARPARLRSVLDRRKFAGRIVPPDGNASVLATRRDVLTAIRDRDSLNWERMVATNLRQKLDAICVIPSEEGDPVSRCEYDNGRVRMYGQRSNGIVRAKIDASSTRVGIVLPLMHIDPAIRRAHRTTGNRSSF